MATCYIVQEVDGTSRFVLEDGSGFLVLEDCVPTATGDSVMGGVPQRGAQEALLRRRRQEQDEEDFLILLNGI